MDASHSNKLGKNELEVEIDRKALLTISPNWRRAEKCLKCSLSSTVALLSTVTRAVSPLDRSVLKRVNAASLPQNFPGVPLLPPMRIGITEFELGTFTNTAGMEIAESRFKNIGRDSCLEILKYRMKKSQEECHLLLLFGCRIRSKASEGVSENRIE